MTSRICPRRDHYLPEKAVANLACTKCGEPISSVSYFQQIQPDDEYPQREAFSENEPADVPDESEVESDITYTDVRKRSGNGAAMLAILALLMPLFELGVIVWQSMPPSAIILGCGTVIVTAVLFAAGAAMLVRRDFREKDRGGPLNLFARIMLLWIICYPMAFFRRSHFGRPNFGALAIPIAAFSLVIRTIRFVTNFGEFGVFPNGKSREVTTMVHEMVLESPIGPTLQSIHSHKEIGSNPKGITRKYKCVAETKSGPIPVTYRVKWVDKSRESFQVILDLIVPNEPPRCTDADIIKKSVVKHEEIRYDQKTMALLRPFPLTFFLDCLSAESASIQPAGRLSCMTE